MMNATKKVGGKNLSRTLFAEENSGLSFWESGFSLKDPFGTDESIAHGPFV